MFRKLKKAMEVMAGMAVVAMMGGAAYIMMDKKKQEKVNKILNNAADEANKMMKKMEK